MVNNYYAENYLSFESIDLNFKNGLVVFTGPSGSGKSILMKSFVNVFGLNKEISPEYSEASITNTKIENELYNIEKDEDIVFKQINKGKSKFYLNDRTITKKNISEISLELIKYLHLKNQDDFKKENLLSFIDNIIFSKDSNYKSKLFEFKKEFKKLKEFEKELKELEQNEKDIENLKDFLKFELSQIENFNLSEEEYEELVEKKKRLSSKDKLMEKINEVEHIFFNIYKISNVLEMIGKDSTEFETIVSEAESQIHNEISKFEELDNIDIEDLLDTLENTSKLVKKYGSIEDILIAKDEKQKELEKYENITFEKNIISKKIKEQNEIVENLSNFISNNRKKELPGIKKELNKISKQLFLENIGIDFIEDIISENGKDNVLLSLNNTELSKISSGEFNRLRLSLLYIKNEYNFSDSNILFLDEIDSNLSGKESESIANVLKQLSKKNQIFAISHQPQLTSIADQHFIVNKSNGKSIVMELSEDEKIEEIARMISGEILDENAVLFAKKLIKERQKN